MYREINAPRADSDAAHDATKPKPEPPFGRQRQHGRNDNSSQPRRELSARQQDSIRQHARSRAQAFLERERAGRGLSASETKKRRTELERQIRVSAGRHEAFVQDELTYEDELQAHIKTLFAQKKLSESALVDAVQGWAIQRSRSRVQTCMWRARRHSPFSRRLTTEAAVPPKLRWAGGAVLRIPRAAAGGDAGGNRPATRDRRGWL